MPIKDAAKKALRQTAKRAERNRLAKTNLRYLVKSARHAITKQAPTANEAVQKAGRALDRAAQKKIIKQNTAARTKSRLARALHAAAKPAKA